MPQTAWGRIYAIVAVVMLAILGLIALAVPDGRKGGLDWFGQLIQGGWMAWSFPIALFFWIIAGLLILFTLLAIRYPETPRVGILGIETTRGDRLFITLLGSAFINLIWLGTGMEPQWHALGICAVYAGIVFKWV